ncbi:MAG TPA: ABC transporter substrate-binding protein [Xanthobacteraceae bacterium]|jgi:ABC-type nitrate/sulfonate/bicarbonate transport system substrate-binding protein
MGAISRRAALRGCAAAGVLGSGMLAGRLSGAPVTLRIGYGGAAEEPLWLLIAKPDLGRHHGRLYSIDGTKFQGSDKRAQAFEADAIDLAAGGANGFIFAAAEGINVKIIASLCRESSRGFSTSYFAKAHSAVRSVPDLKGKVVGLNGFSTSGHLWLWAALGRHGLSDADVTIAPVPFSAMQEALIAGKIDVGEFPQPFAALLEKEAAVSKVFDAKYGMPFEEELDVIVGKDMFIKKNEPAVRAFLDDLKEAMRFYLEQPKEARQLLIDTRMVRVSPSVYLGMKDYYRDPTLRPDIDALTRMQEFQVRAGFQKKSIDIPSMVDASYLPN